MCFPTFQVPSAIKRIYNSNSITSTSGGAGVDVAVLDTGVYKEHLDLKGNVAQCKNFVGKMKEGCSDGNGHGTHVSGTIAANAGTDKKGIYGVAPEAKLLAYKVCNDAGVCSGDSIAKAIRYAADNGAEVISMSLGGDKLSTVEKEAIDYATSNGVLVVAAAGNSGPDLDTILYPAAYDKVVAVAATNTGSSPSVYDFSSRGVNDGDYVIEEREVEVGAPGSTQSTYKDGCYYYLAGTSMATPHVSGLAAKFWNSGKADIDLDGVTTAEEVRQYLQTRANATDIVNGLHAAAGDDPASGFGFPTVPPS
jgi:subtilisin